MWAAHHGFPHRVALLLAAGVDPDGRGTRHPVLKGRTALEVALAARPRERRGRSCATAARASRSSTTAQTVEAAYMRADASVTAPPPPGLIVRAAEYGRADVVALLLERGADVNAMPGRATALHEAALRGDRALVDQLLAAGADPALHDREFGSTPAGWAEHAGHAELAERLR